MSRTAIAWFIGLVLAFTFGCNRAQNQGPDPADANLAPADQSAQTAETAQYAPAGSEQELSEAPQPPPPLPEYSQPPCPGDGYLWTPGYWAYSEAGYYWVPGDWVEAPWVGALWTPPYWGYSGNHYLWHAGYWGPHVGFYGGINYGFGYTGVGFYGGYWNGGVFNYNRAALNVNTREVHNIYDRDVVNRTTFNRISYNGPQGVNVRPTASENVAFRERRMGAVPAQTQLRQEAAGNRAQFATENHGKPAMPVARPAGSPNQRPAAEFSGRTAQPAPNMPMQRPEERNSNVRAEPPRQPEVRQTPTAGPQERGRGPEVRAEGRQAPPPTQPQGNHPAPAFNRQAQQQPRPEAHANVPQAPPQARPQVNHPAPEVNRQAQQQPRPEVRPNVRQEPPQQAQPAPQRHAEPPRPSPTPQAHVEAPRPSPAQQQPHPEAAHPAPPAHPEQHGAPPDKKDRGKQ